MRPDTDLERTSLKRNRIFGTEMRHRVAEFSDQISPQMSCEIPLELQTRPIVSLSSYFWR